MENLLKKFIMKYLLFRSKFKVFIAFASTRLHIFYKYKQYVLYFSYK